MCNLIVSRDFPLPRIQTGATLGNSYLGVMVWGAEELLNISFGCGALWDHRGGLEWTPKVRFKDIRSALIRNDAEAIKAIFQPENEAVAGQPARPSLVPVGRIELRLKKGCRLLRYELRLVDGRLRIVYDRAGTEGIAEFRLDMEEKGRFAFRCADAADIRIRNSFELSCGKLAKISIPAPVEFAAGTGAGFVNTLPADDAFGLFYRRDGEQFTVAFGRDAAPETLRRRLGDTAAADWDALETENSRWWRAYWRDVPELRVDNEALSELYWHGLFKFGSMTDPSGVAAGLQGPWIEDDDFPPWQGDYHFNINLQMCYSPAYRANRMQNLRPVFRMLADWLPRLRRNAKYFVGIDDGVMLPHAVDDRGVCMGSFWTGAIDHACAAWMAQMMFDYYDYSGDLAFLRDFGFEFMCGVMRVFELMLERDGARLKLPVSVSPEYRAARMDAWGADSSFQVAAIHRLAENLIAAAAALGKEPDPVWLDIRKNLPLASIWRGKEKAPDPQYVWQPGAPEIGMWDGVVLEESHRHHSHLAGICPFDVIDLDDPEWKKIVDNTRLRWIKLGMGEWSGWSMPWAAMLHNRMNNGEMSELILEIYKRAYTNEGGGSLHDTAFKGFSLMGEWDRSEVMQMDAAMGAVTAVQDMFVQTRRGVLWVGAGIPRRWKNVSVRSMPAPGGFRVSAEIDRGKCSRIVIEASRANTLKLALPVPERAWRLPESADTFAPGKIAIALAAGETLTLESC